MKPGWTEAPLGELCDLAKGISPTMASEPGPYPLVVTAAFRRTSNTFQFTRPAACIPSISSTGHGNAAIHRIHYQEGHFALANLLVAATPRDESLLSANFLWRYLSAVKDRKLVPLMQGTANVSLKEADLRGVTIEFPSRTEQQRITDRLDAIEARLNRVRQLRIEAGRKKEALTTSLHLAMAKDRVMRLTEILELAEEQCAVVPAGSYPQVGIRSFGLGFFKKLPVAGTATTYRTFNVLRPGMFVMSQVKGWEGAIGVCGADFDGWFVSPEYRTFTCIEGACDPAYLSHLVATPWFRDQLASATRGVGARRERVRPEMLLSLEMPFPRIEKQREAARALGQLRTSQETSGKADAAHDALIPSLLNQIFSN